jgi:hypothetical protein
MIETFRQELSPKPWKRIANDSCKDAGSSGDVPSSNFGVEMIRHKVKWLGTVPRLMAVRD